MKPLDERHITWGLRKDGTEWYRVQFNRRPYTYIDKTFDDYESAKAFRDKIEAELER